jgi:hypothetical protein
MKKTFSILAIALVLLSCNKEHRLAMASADKDFILKVANKEFEKKNGQMLLRYTKDLPIW